jgi:polysaccharide biosynthesis protein PslH
MKILVISERMPARFGGGRSRQFNLLQTLSGRHEFTVIAFHGPDDDDAAKELRSFCHEVVELPLPPVPALRSRTYYRITGWKHTLFDLYPDRGRILLSAESKRIIGRQLKMVDYDVMQIHQLYLAPLLPTVMRTATLLDMHDVLSDFEHQKIAVQAKFTDRLGAYLEWKKMQHFERRVLPRFDVCSVVSDNDRNSLRRVVRNINPIVIPNGVDEQYFSPLLSSTMQDNAIIFVGSMNYPPNTEGILRFYHHIWPMVQSCSPNTKLWIVGIAPPDSVTALDGRDNVEVLGFVPDIRSYLAKAKVAIVPLYSGSGTRLKILDAWAMGKAVVSTWLGAEGLEAIHGENILLADEPEQFAAFVLNSLNNDVLRHRLGRAGRQTILDSYTWSAISKKMEAAYHTSLNHYKRDEGYEDSISDHS